MSSHATPVTLCLEGLSIYAHHGLLAEEQRLGQRFEFDVEVEIADCAACLSDAPADAVAYEALAAVVVEVATNFRFGHMEALAEAVCAEILAEFPVERVRLSVAKPAPSIPHAVARAVVRIERGAVSPPAPVG